MTSKPRSKVVRARAKAAEVRVGKQAIVNTLKTEARGAKKMESIMETVAAVGEDGELKRCYAVQVDNQGVAYLRCAETAKGAQFVVNTGPEIQVVEMDLGTQRSRGLKTVPEASVLEATEILARPLTKSVIISKRAKAALDVILNDKEFIAMANATRKAKKAAEKSGAAAKTGKTASKSNGAGRSPKVSIEDRFAVAKKIIGSKKEVSKKDFAAGLKAVYPNFYSTTKRLLAEAGYIKIDAKTAAVSLK